MNKRKKESAVLWIVISVMMVLLCACGADDEKVPVYTEGVSIDETMVMETPGIAVENPYMTYSYAADLADVLIVRDTVEENRHEAVFLADISGQEVELFSVVLGTDAEENGFEVGVLEDASLGTIHVTLVMNEQKEENWSEEHFAQINALQERINDIIVQFYDDPRFVAGR